MVLYAIAFDFDCPFTFKRAKIRYGGYDFIFHYGGENNVDVIETLLQNDDESDSFAQTAIEFCHKIVKHNKTCSFSYVLEFSIGGVNETDLMTKEPAIRIKRRSNIPTAYINQIGDFLSTEQEIATSLINDAQHTKNPFFRFLCLWKILELPIDSHGRNAKDWINNILSENQSNLDLNDNLLKMIESNTDIGEHFKENFRNAITHISRPPFLSSHNYNHFRKVSLACTDLKIFIEYFLRHEIGWYNPSIRNEIVEII